MGRACILPATGEHTPPHPSVSAPHSRYHSQVRMPLEPGDPEAVDRRGVDRRGVERNAVQLSWDEASNSAECAALSTEGSQLSNAGAVRFELELCTTAECSRPTLTLRDCQLEAGGRVMPRKVVLDDPRGDGIPGIGSVVVALLVGACCVRFMWRQSRQTLAKPSKM